MSRGLSTGIISHLAKASGADLTKIQSVCAAFFSELRVLIFPELPAYPVPRKLHENYSRKHNSAADYLPGAHALISPEKTYFIGDKSGYRSHDGFQRQYQRRRGRVDALLTYDLQGISNAAGKHAGVKHRNAPLTSCSRRAARK